MVDFNKFRWTPEKNHKLDFDRPTEREQLDDAHNDAPPWNPDEEDLPDLSNAELTANYVKEQIHLITETVRKANRTDMLNRNRGNNNRGQKTKNGLPYLDVKEVSRDKTRYRILWAGEPSEAEAPDWGVVTLKLESVESHKKVLWTLSDNNPCLDLLENELGSEEKDWTGRELFVWKEKVGVAEKEYIRIEVAASEAAADTSTTRARR